jgi:hypothetical protein
VKELQQVEVRPAIARAEVEESAFLGRTCLLIPDRMAVAVGRTIRSRQNACSVQLRQTRTC